MKAATSQNTAILKDLLAGKRITPLDALQDYGCFRLSARIYDLRQSHPEIETSVIRRNGKRFAVYFIPQKCLEGAA